MVKYDVEYLRESWERMLQSMNGIKRYADRVRWYYKAQRHKMFWQDMCPAYASAIQHEWDTNWERRFRKALG